MIASDRPGSRSPRALLLALLLAGAGCGEGRGPGKPTVPDTPYDPALARKALIEALDAWKQGAAASLARRSPPIRFADEDQAAGLKLADYTIEGGERDVAARQPIVVNLTLKDAGGQPIRRLASYQVGTSPTLSVLRSDE